MTPARLMLLSAAAVTTACASMPASPVEPAPAGSGAPQPLEGYDWFVDGDDGDVQLTFGRDESDNVWMTLRCQPGSGTIGLDHYVAPDGARAIALESGGETGTWPARREPDDLNDGVYLTAEASASAPVFQRFRRLGWIAAYGPDWRTPMVAHPASAPRVERFFAACG